MSLCGFILVSLLTFVALVTVSKMRQEIIIFLSFRLFLVQGNIDKPLAYIGSEVNLSCRSKAVPIWSWYGKMTTIAKMLASGHKKHPRFDDDR